MANDDTYGVIRLTLHPAGYDWEFMPEQRHGKFSDSGNGDAMPLRRVHKWAATSALSLGPDDGGRGIGHDSVWNRSDR